MKKRNPKRFLAKNIYLEVCDYYKKSYIVIHTVYFVYLFPFCEFNLSNFRLNYTSKLKLFYISFGLCCRILNKNFFVSNNYRCGI